MSHFQVLFLIGLPAAGKSTIGHKLAQKTGRAFLDTDQIIEDQTGISIPAFFAQYGPYRFREQERSALSYIAKTVTTPTIIATGGGLPCFFDNMDTMLRLGHVMWVQAPISTIVRRLISQIDSRPLLAELEPEQVGHWLLDVLSARHYYYRRANSILTDTMDLDEVAGMPSIFA